VSQRAFVGVSALLLAASAALTIAWCESMSAMGEMLMPGGRTMSMVWMRTPAQTWPGAAASFLGMWVVMMVALGFRNDPANVAGYGSAASRYARQTRLGRWS
jgi:hypothetical protein